MKGKRYEIELNGSIEEWCSLDADPIEMNCIINALKYYVTTKPDVKFETKMLAGTLALELKDIHDSQPEQI